MSATLSVDTLAKILADEVLDIACEVFDLNPNESEIYEFRKAVITRATNLIVPPQSA